MAQRTSKIVSKKVVCVSSQSHILKFAYLGNLKSDFKLVFDFKVKALTNDFPAFIV